MQRLREFLFIKRPNTPGYGISRNAYLTVLAGRSGLPSIAEVIAPKAEAPVVAGFGVPMSAGGGRALLEKPIERGTYGFASLDKKTALRVAVLPPAEAGFHPDALLQSPAAVNLREEVRWRIGSAWWLIQITFESHHAEVIPALSFWISVARRMAELTAGVIADPLAEKYLLPEDVHDPQGFDIRDHISVIQSPARIATRGMSKFALPEIQFSDVEPDDRDLAAGFLYSVADAILHRGPIEPGNQIGTVEVPIDVAAAPNLQGPPVLELIPPPGKTVGQAVTLIHDAHER